MSIIDIIRLMNSGQQPTSNPYQNWSRASADTVDPTGVPVNAGDILDDQGTLVSDKDRIKGFQAAEKAGSQTAPFKPITGLAATFNPEAANYVFQQNDAASRAERERKIRRTIAGEDVDTVPSGLLPVSGDRNANITLTGGNATGQNLYDLKKAMAQMSAGNPEATAQLNSEQIEAEKQAAALALANTKSAIARQPVTSAAADAQAVNDLAAATKVDPLKIKLLQQQLTGELGRSPTTEELKSEILKGQVSDTALANKVSQFKLDNSGKILSNVGSDIDVHAASNQTALAQNELALKQARAALFRNDVVESGKDQEAVNNLRALTDLDPQKIQLAINQVRGDLKRDPTHQEVMNNLMEQQLNESKLSKGVSETKLDMMDYIRQTEKNRIIGDALMSRYVPPSQFPMASRIEDNGTITPYARVPGYVNMIDAMNAKFQGGMGTRDITGPSGRVYKVRDTQEPIDALSGQPVPRMPIANIEPTTVGSTNNISTAPPVPVKKPISTIQQEADILGIKDSDLRNAMKRLGVGLGDFGSRFGTEILGIAPKGYHWKRDVNGVKVLEKN